MTAQPCREPNSIPDDDDLAKNLLAAYDGDATAALRYVIADAESCTTNLLLPPPF